MSFSHTLLDELQLPSGITMPGERTKPDFWISGGSVVAKFSCALRDPLVIRKSDSNASIRVWEKGMKRDELRHVS